MFAKSPSSTEDTRAEDREGLLGIIAGNGILPIQLAKRAKMQGRQVFVVGHRGETDPALVDMVDGHCWVRVGQLGKILSALKRAKVTEVIFAGGIRRTKLFTDLRPDWRALQLIARVGSVRDDSILRAVAAEFEREGMSVVSATAFLGDFLAAKGLLTSRPLTEREKEDAGLAWKAAEAIGALDIGQGAVAFEGIVVALEAIEGTDAMLSRAGKLIENKKGFVLVKRAKPQQDLRLDLPTVGKKTLETLSANGGTALVLEDQKAIILEPQEFLQMANSLQIAVEVW